MAVDADLPTPVLRALRIVGAAALVGLVGLVAGLDRRIALDDRVWRAVLFARGCGADLVVDRTVEVATLALTLLLVVATLLHVRTHGVRSAFPWVSTALLGLLASKTLKHVLTRERPSMLPDVALGYSFPSAHVMNSVTAMLAVIALTYGFRHHRLWSIVAGVLTATVTAGRVLLGHHWACDAAGGVLAALVLVGMVTPAIVRRPARASLALAAALTIAYTVDRWLGDAGWRLPAPLVGSRVALVDVDVGERIRPQLAGKWLESAEEHPGGSLVWLEGSGTIPFDVPDAVVVGARGTRAHGLRLAFGGRTEKDPEACLTIGVDLNGRPLASFVPFNGWREYRLPVPPGLLHAGRNELAISAGAGGAPARFAVAYVRLADAATVP